MGKKMKKATSLVLAFAATAATMGMFTACETKNPEVEMKIEFAGEVYTLEYKLYRELAPATVKHFIKLVENEYYNGLCVHNFDEGANKMYAGAYQYDANVENGGLVYKQYYDIVSKYDGFEHTVWVDSDKAMPTYTLKGEFGANSFKVESGELKQSFGSLTMQYTQKDFDDLEEVAVLRSKGDRTDNKSYEYNSATSQFSIFLSKTETADSAHCTFATLEEGSVSVLEALLAAIDEYESDFVNEYVWDVDQDDLVLGDRENTATYKIPVSPIVIQSMKVTKY
ncbi:MAG: hypothetical protein E7349_03495 [Clostridiales bacterium]|nr:hypothetical protein [Clostridiales bacterium]